MTTSPAQTFVTRTESVRYNLMFNNPRAAQALGDIQYAVKQGITTPTAGVVQVVALARMTRNALDKAALNQLAHNLKEALVA